VGDVICERNEKYILVRKSEWKKPPEDLGIVWKIILK
jgi:hypothetical protein